MYLGEFLFSFPPLAFRLVLSLRFVATYSAGMTLLHRKLTLTPYRSVTSTEDAELLASIQEEIGLAALLRENSASAYTKDAPRAEIAEDI